jgi:hypothetical protein
MARLTITYWRDIPSALSVREGRREEKRLLPPRFQEAIDMAAMKAGAIGTDDYLAAWRRGEPSEVTGDLTAAADAAAADIESRYDDEKLKILTAQGGTENP